MKNNSILPTDEGNFQKKTNERSKYKGQVPIMEKSWLDKLRGKIMKKEGYRER